MREEKALSNLIRRLESALSDEGVAVHALVLEPEAVAPRDRSMDGLALNLSSCYRLRVAKIPISYLQSNKALILYCNPLYTSYTAIKSIRLTLSLRTPCCPILH